MMKRNSFITILFLMIIACTISCSNGAGDEKVAGNEGSMNTDIDSISKQVENLNLLPGCYRMSIQKDTAFLKLNVDNERVNGTLSYKPFEKDESNGTFEGTIKKDILRTWYTFQSEGKTSVREVYFKVINNKLAEGYGDVFEKNDSIYFKYPAALNFEDKHPYMKLDCN